MHTMLCSYHALVIAGKQLTKVADLQDWRWPSAVQHHVIQLHARVALDLLFQHKQPAPLTCYTKIYPMPRPTFTSRLAMPRR